MQGHAQLSSMYTEHAYTLKGFIGNTPRCLCQGYIQCAGRPPEFSKGQVPYLSGLGRARRLVGVHTLAHGNSIQE